MAKRYLLTLLLVLASMVATAQNSIDRMVERYSTVGGSSFVTAVKRNPKTRKVEKVVKRLTTHSPQNGRFVSAFKEEAAHQKDVVTSTADGYTTMIISVEGAKQNRIYTLRYKGGGYAGEVTITIIINMKD